MALSRRVSSGRPVGDTVRSQPVDNLVDDGPVRLGTAPWTTRPRTPRTCGQRWTTDARAPVVPRPSAGPSPAVHTPRGQRRAPRPATTRVVPSVHTTYDEYVLVTRKGASSNRYASLACGSWGPGHRTARASSTTGTFLPSTGPSGGHRVPSVRSWVVRGSMTLTAALGAAHTRSSRPDRSDPT